MTYRLVPPRVVSTLFLVLAAFLLANRATAQEALANDPRLAPLTPEVRKMVLDEAAMWRRNCDSDQVVMNFYECDCYVREAFEERLRIGTAVAIRKHGVTGSEFTHFATVLSRPPGTAACVVTEKIEAYGAKQATEVVAMQPHLTAPQKAQVVECTAKELAARFKQQPSPNHNHAVSLLNEAMGSCMQPLTSALSTQFSATNPTAAPSPPPPGPGAQATASSQTQTPPNAGSSPKSDGPPGNFSGAWVIVSRSGPGADAYLPGHLAESSVLHIEHAGGLLTLGKKPEHRFTTYHVDGVEHPFSWTRPNVPPDVATTTGKVLGKQDGNRVVLDIEMNLPGFNTVVKRAFSLTADGGLLIETTGGVFRKDGTLQHDLNTTWLFKRFDPGPQPVLAPSQQISSAPAPPVGTAPKTPPAPAQPPAPAAPVQAGPTKEETLAERQAQADKQTASTNAVLSELQQKSQAALANAQKQSACMQRAAQANADQASTAFRTAFDACMAEGGAGKPQATTAQLGAPWGPCSAAPRSVESKTAVPVEFANSSTQPRKLYWVDFAGNRQLYGVLQAGQRGSIQSFVTHAWIAADGSDVCLGTLVIGKGGRIEIQ